MAYTQISAAALAAHNLRQCGGSACGCRACALDEEGRDRLRQAHAAGEHREHIREHCPPCMQEHRPA